MKKTLIALAMTASVVVSGTAMAATWTANGGGDIFSLRGTLTPANNDTPWEVKTGDTVTNLEGLITKGDKSTVVIVRSPIPVLGIRNKSDHFMGKKGILPQIDYGPAVEIDKFQNSRAPVTLDVKDKNDRKIGTLTTNLTAGAAVYWISRYYEDNNINGQGSSCFAPRGSAFYGGLPETEGQTATDAFMRAKSILPDLQPFAVSNQINNVHDKLNARPDIFETTDNQIQAYYGSGFAVEEKINITLDAPAQGDNAIEWKASLPVTVYYR